MTKKSENDGVMIFFHGHALAATIAGTLEIAFFHPVDTICKRLMSNQQQILSKNLTTSVSNLNQIIFKKHASSSIVKKIEYLYPGSLYAVMYKVLQRVYKFAGQPLIKDAIQQHYGEKSKEIFGRKSKIVNESVAGCLIGIGEVALLPFDRMKVLAQTNEGALKNRSFLRVIADEGLIKLYAGTFVTMARNAPGSFCLFGGAAFAKDVILGLEDYSKATFLQNIFASTIGSCLSVTITNPLDVVKTRIQNREFHHEKVTAPMIINQMIREEGPAAFFKGLTPKLVASAPKLIFAYTMTEYFKHLFDELRRSRTVVLS